MAKKSVNESWPADLKRGWLGVCRSLQAAARSPRYPRAGFSFVILKILIDPDGNPVFHECPDPVRLEPSMSADEFLSKLVDSYRKGL